MAKFLIFELLLDLLVFLLSIPALLLLFLVLSPLYLWRLTVQVLARVFKSRELLGMLPTLEMLFMPMEPSDSDPAEPLHLRPDSLVVAQLVLEGPVDLDQFRANFLQNVLSEPGSKSGPVPYARLRQHVVTWLGYAFFKWDPNFQIQNHILEVREPVTEATVTGFIGSALSAPFPKGSSMWEIWLVPAYNGEDRTLLLLRFSHCLGDGFSWLQLMSTRIMSLAGPAITRPLPAPEPEERVPLAQRARRLYANTIGLPRGYLREQSEVFGNCLEPKGEGRGNEIWVARSEGIPLEGIKELKRRSQIPFSVALNAAVAEALRGHVREELGVLDKKWAPGFTVVPDLARGHPDDQLVNHFGVLNMVVSLTDDDSTKTLAGRLESSRAHFRAMKASANTKLGYCMLLVLNSLPVPILKTMSLPYITYMYSNFPGPAEPADLWTNRVSEMMFWVKPRSAQVVPSRNSVPVVTVSIMSYLGLLRVGVLANSNFISSQAQIDGLVRRITIELQEMRKLG